MSIAWPRGRQCSQVCLRPRRQVQVWHRSAATLGACACACVRCCRYRREVLYVASKLNFRSPAREVTIDTGSPDFIKWDDINGIDEVKKEITEIIDYLKDPALLRSRGVARIGGVLLAGAPGTGEALQQAGWAAPVPDSRWLVRLLFLLVSVVVHAYGTYPEHAPSPPKHPQSELACSAPHALTPALLLMRLAGLACRQDAAGQGHRRGERCAHVHLLGHGLLRRLQVRRPRHVHACMHAA